MIDTEPYFNAMNSLKVLKPVKTYPANSGRKTSITGFDEMLNRVSGREENKKAEKQDKTDTESTEIIGVGVCGEDEAIKLLTKKFSLAK